MITVIIPTLNEKKNIKKISTKLNKIKIISEVIFIDDNSSDGTFEEIKKIKYAKFKGILRSSKDKDLSKSVILGSSKAKNNILMVMDCDLQHDVKYINKMWKIFKISKCDILIASRFSTRYFFGNISFFRSFISKSAIFIINFIFGFKSSDPLSGFFICKKYLIVKYKKNFYSKGYKILFDILYNRKKTIFCKDFSIIFKKRRFENSKFNIQIIKLFLYQMFYTKFLVKIKDIL